MILLHLILNHSNAHHFQNSQLQLKHGDKVIVIDQLEDKIGTAKRCSNIIEGVLKECL